MTRITLDEMLNAQMLGLDLSQSDENTIITAHVSLSQKRLFHTGIATFSDAIPGIAFENNEVCLVHSHCSETQLRFVFWS